MVLHGLCVQSQTWKRLVEVQPVVSETTEILIKANDVVFVIRGTELRLFNEIITLKTFAVV